MDFQQTWRQQIQERLARFADSARAEFREVGPNLLYGFLSAMALWPVAEAVQGGELAALGAFFGVAGGVGANLIANQVQSWKGEADAAEQLSQAAQTDPDVRKALDTLLGKLDVIGQAQAGMSDQDRDWFQETLRSEVARLGSSLTVVTVTGPGAAAVAEHSVVGGAESTGVCGDVLGEMTHVAVDVAAALCPRQVPDGAVSETDWWAAYRAGKALLEIGLEEVKARERHEQVLARVRGWLVALIERGALTPVERAAAGNVLAQLGDPRFREDAFCLPDEPLLGLVEIPAGPFLMGTRWEDILALMEKYGGDREWYERETPQHRLELPAYYIARYPVTHAQYAVFVREMGHKPPTAEVDDERPYEWREGNYPSQRANQPVVLVTWYDALEYCRWLTGKLRAWSGTPERLANLLRNEGWIVTLPTEAQWEKAARGEDGRVFPWGDEFDPAKCNVDETGIGTTGAVGTFPGGASPYGVLDLSGNVWEWTRSLWGEGLLEPSFKYPYDPADDREDLDAPDSIHRVLRGGAFLDFARDVRCAFRSSYVPYYFSRYGGFRVCVVSRQD